MSRRPKLDAAAAALRRDAGRSNEAIARAVGCGPHTVAQARAELEEAGALPQGSRRYGRVAAAVEAELRRDHLRSNETIAQIVGCKPATVAKTRSRLLARQVIGRRSQTQNAVFEAVRAELVRDPHRPNTEIAAALGCSQSRVWQVRETLEVAGEIPRRRTRHELIVEALRGWAGTQKELATKLGIQPTYISYVLRQERERERTRKLLEKKP